MNKVKKVVSVGIAAALTLTSLPTVVSAENEFLSATELISATVEMAANNVQSDTYADSLTAVEAKVTTSGDEVFYDGDSIGFWFSDTPNIIYKDEEKTAIALQTDTTTGGYTADPTLLCEIMADFNNGLVSTAVPTTTDWSKIIGKYDVKLGDLTVPAENWIPLEIKQDDELLPSDSEDHDYFYNFSSEKGIGTDDLVDNRFGKGSLYFFFYIVDNSGKLYVQDVTVDLQGSGRANHLRTMQLNDQSIESSHYWCYPGSTTSSYSDEVSYINTAIGINSDNKPFGCVFATNFTADSYTSNAFAECTVAFRDITDPAVVFTGAIADIKTQGMFYSSVIADGQVYPEQSECPVYFRKFFDTQSCSRTTTGNTTLEQRLAKLVSLAPTDTITVSDTGWTVNGIDNLDTYIGTHSVIEPGTGTDVSAVADIEAACFDVVIPTNLPIYVDDRGQVTVADNASIKNKSSLAVKITDVEIKAKPDTGWTLVDTSPSKSRDAKEFTFTTSLTADMELDVDETVTFTYDAQISPTTEGYTSLDLATVTVVVDWAPVDNS